MRKIEEQFAEGLVVIGVHSGKYIAERETPRIREASLRYGITHPIVNDRQFRVWRSYAVRAWPTLAVIDRNGYVVGAHAGEFTSEMLQPLLEALVLMTAEGLKGRSMHFPPERPGIDPGFLRYPGKVAVDGERIAISDSGNHRVIVGTLETDKRMRVQHTIHQLWAIDATTGAARVHCGTAGEDIVDGSHSSALLAQPMGITTDGKRLYFADSESSAIRWADIDPNGEVGTIVGTGLFDFGDVDGMGENVRMQHQQGVTRNRDGELLIADSYNDALKWLNVDSRQARTWLRDFHEPGGVAAGQRSAYIADTNAHRIIVADYETGDTQELEIAS